MEWTGYRLDREIFLHNGGGVLWAIGVSMMFLAALVYLPRWLILAIGLALIVNHNSFDQFDPAWADITPGQFGPVPLASGAGILASCTSAGRRGPSANSLTAAATRSCRGSA